MADEKDLVPIKLLSRLNNKHPGEITARPKAEAQALIAKGHAKLYRPDAGGEEAKEEEATAPRREGRPPRSTRMVKASVEK